MVVGVRALETVKMESCVNQSNICHESKSNESNYETKPFCIENGPRIITMQRSFLENDACMVSLVFLMTILVVFYRATASASISKDSMAYLFRDFVLCIIEITALEKFRLFANSIYWQLFRFMHHFATNTFEPVDFLAVLLSIHSSYD